MDRRTRTCGGPERPCWHEFRSRIPPYTSSHAAKPDESSSDADIFLFTELNVVDKHGKTALQIAGDLGDCFYETQSFDFFGEDEPETEPEDQRNWRAQIFAEIIDARETDIQWNAREVEMAAGLGLFSVCTDLLDQGRVELFDLSTVQAAFRSAREDMKEMSEKRSRKRRKKAGGAASSSGKKAPTTKGAPPPACTVVNTGFGVVLRILRAISQQIEISQWCSWGEDFVFPVSPFCLLCWAASAETTNGTEDPEKHQTLNVVKSVLKHDAFQPEASEFHSFCEVDDFPELDRVSEDGCFYASLFSAPPGLFSTDPISDEVFELLASSPKLRDRTPLQQEEEEEEDSFRDPRHVPGELRSVFSEVDCGVDGISLLAYYLYSPKVITDYARHNLARAERIIRDPSLLGELGGQALADLCILADSDSSCIIADGRSISESPLVKRLMKLTKAGSDGPSLRSCGRGGMKTALHAVAAAEDRVAAFPAKRRLCLALLAQLSEGACSTSVKFGDDFELPPLYLFFEPDRERDAGGLTTSSLEREALKLVRAVLRKTSAAALNWKDKKGRSTVSLLLFGHSQMTDKLSPAIGGPAWHMAVVREIASDPRFASMDEESRAFLRKETVAGQGSRK